jgi:hypothetical protein
VFHSEKFNRNILLGILICLMVIAIKPVPTLETRDIQIPSFPNELDITELHDTTVVQLDKNRFALIDKDHSAYTKILVLEYDEKTKKLNRVSKSSFDFNLEFNFK